MKNALRNLITVNTSKGSDKFYFKNPAKVGTVNGVDAYCVFYYSHYDEYMVYAIAWKGGKYSFHYLQESDMLPTYEFHFRTLNDSGQFIPAIDIVDIDSNYLDVIYNATQEEENISYNTKYSALYDRQRHLQYNFQKLRHGVNGYNRYDEETYLSEFPKRLELSEYKLLHERYVNLKPNVKAEEELELQKSYTREQILSEMIKDKKSNDMMMSLLDEILNEEKSK